MKLNARKSLMKALGDASLRDFKSPEEMQISRTLYNTMTDNDRLEDQPKPRKKREKKAELAEAIV